MAAVRDVSFNSLMKCERAITPQCHPKRSEDLLLFRINELRAADPSSRSLLGMTQ
jgi:hypothetical protein